jgi:hypothetical protein
MWIQVFIVCGAELEIVDSIRDPSRPSPLSDVSTGALVPSRKASPATGPMRAMLRSKTSDAADVVAVVATPGITGTPGTQFRNAFSATTALARDRLRGIS